MTWGIVLMVVGIGAFIESLFSLIFTKTTAKIVKKMGIMKKWQNVKTIKKVAWWEFVIAIIIFMIGINI